jgi:hypothetical protein
MATKRRQKPEGWFEREGEGLIQRGQSRKARLESAATRGWLKERQLLCSQRWADEDVAEGGEEP